MQILQPELNRTRRTQLFNGRPRSIEQLVPSPHTHPGMAQPVCPVAWGLGLRSLRDGVDASIDQSRANIETLANSKRIAKIGGVAFAFQAMLWTASEAFKYFPSLTSFPARIFGITQ